MAFKIYHSKTFDEKLEKMPKDFILWLDKIEDQLGDLLPTLKCGASSN